MNTAMLGTYWECWILIVAAPVGDALGRLRTGSAAWPSRRTCKKRHSAQWPPSKRCSQRPGRRPAGILPPRKHAESTEHWSHLELTLVMHSLVECALGRLCRQRPTRRPARNVGSMLGALVGEALGGGVSPAKMTT